MVVAETGGFVGSGGGSTVSRDMEVVDRRSVALGALEIDRGADSTETAGISIPRELVGSSTLCLLSASGGRVVDCEDPIRWFATVSGKVGPREFCRKGSSHCAREPSSRALTSSNTLWRKSPEVCTNARVRWRIWERGTSRSGAPVLGAWRFLRTVSLDAVDCLDVVAVSAEATAALVLDAFFATGSDFDLSTWTAVSTDVVDGGGEEEGFTVVFLAADLSLTPDEASPMPFDFFSVGVDVDGAGDRVGVVAVEDFLAEAGPRLFDAARVFCKGEESTAATGSASRTPPLSSSCWTFFLGGRPLFLVVTCADILLACSCSCLVVLVYSKCDSAGA